MEKYTFDNDIQVVCVTASSFPEGVMKAHEHLHSIVPYSDQRRYFGISRPEQAANGAIVYKAGAEVFDEDAFDNAALEAFTVRKGEYVCITVHDYMQHIPAIGEAFSQLIALPGKDSNGYCIEWYLGTKDVRCMIRIDDNK